MYPKLTVPFLRAALILGTEGLPWFFWPNSNTSNLGVWWTDPSPSIMNYLSLSSPWLFQRKVGQFGLYTYDAAERGRDYDYLIKALVDCYRE